MFVDYQTELSRNQALTTGTITSTNVYDTGAAADVGPGYPIKFIVSATSAFVGGTSVQATLETSNTVGGAYTPLVAGPVKPIAEINANHQIAAVDIPHGAKRFIRASYVIAGTFTAGTVEAFLGLNACGNNNGQIVSGIPRI